MATPGRLLDHLSSGTVRLDCAEVIVLDEADHMLDLGFIIPIRQILARLPRKRQSLFFSATMPKEIAGLAADMLHDPVEIRVAPVATTAERVVQEVFFVNDAGKRDLLVELLRRPDFRRTIVFTRTKRGADKVSQHLEAAGLTAAAIHGNKSQVQRQRALDGFRTGRSSVLVATDIAARGIDVDDVTHVVNYELPDVPEAYVHRIGRTARAGAGGMAVSLCDDSERGLLRAIEKLTRQILPFNDRRAAGQSRDEPRHKMRQGQARPHHNAGGSPEMQHKGKEAVRSKSFAGQNKRRSNNRSPAFVAKLVDV